MRSYEASSVISAPADRIWAILVDGQHYPDWDSGFVSVEGAIGKGETIKVVSNASPDRTFTLTPSDDGATRFDVRKVYSGLLLSLMWRSMPDLAPSFERFASGLKVRAQAAD